MTLSNLVNMTEKKDGRCTPGGWFVWEREWGLVKAGRNAGGQAQDHRPEKRQCCSRQDYADPWPPPAQLVCLAYNKEPRCPSLVFTQDEGPPASPPAHDADSPPHTVQKIVNVGAPSLSPRPEVGDAVGVLVRAKHESALNSQPRHKSCY